MENQSQPQQKKPKSPRILSRISCLLIVFVLLRYFYSGPEWEHWAGFFVLLFFAAALIFTFYMTAVIIKKVVRAVRQPDLKSDNRRYERQTVSRRSSRAEGVRPSNAEAEYGQYMTDEEYLRRSHRYGE